MLDQLSFSPTLITGAGTTLDMFTAWFSREFLAPRRLVFNLIFYGLQLFWFAYGWYLQVLVLPLLPLPRLPSPSKSTTGYMPSTVLGGPSGLPGALVSPSPLMPVSFSSP